MAADETSPTGEPARTPESTRIAELARLARVELAPEDAQTFAAQIDTILSYIRGLQQVDVEGVPESTSSDHPRSSLRDDLASTQADVDLILSAARTNHERLVDVPKFKD